MSADEAAREIDRSEGLKIYITDAAFMDVSATAIRRAVREGREADWIKHVPASVADYIRKYGLYRRA